MRRNDDVGDDACRKSSYDRATVLPASATELHQPGARLLEHVESHVSIDAHRRSLNG